VCRQDIFDLNYDYLPRGFEEHLEMLAKNEYADYIAVCASSRLLEGRIRLYRPDREAPIFIVDEKFDEPEHPKPIMMTAGWVSDSGSGHLDHFELWQEPKEDATQSEAAPTAASAVAAQTPVASASAPAVYYVVLTPLP
jgi:hypothetical protein